MNTSQQILRQAPVTLLQPRNTAYVQHAIPIPKYHTRPLKWHVRPFGATLAHFSFHFMTLMCKRTIHQIVISAQGCLQPCTVMNVRLFVLLYLLIRAMKVSITLLYYDLITLVNPTLPSLALSTYLAIWQYGNHIHILYVIKIIQDF